MLAAMIRTQWRSARGVLLILALVVAFLPFQLLQASEGASGVYSVGDLVSRSAMFSVFYQMTALVAGLILAFSCWQPDLATRHVYALSLPVPRWRYVLSRFAAGLALHLPVAITLAIAAGIACALAPIPPVLHAYPVSLALRWLLGAAVVFSIIFALLTLSVRMSRIVVIVLLGLLVADLTLVAVGVTQSPVIFDTLTSLVRSDSGPAGGFMMRWMLLDV